MNKLLRRLFYGSTRLLTYEQACLDAFRSSIPNEAQSLLNRQMSLLSVVQRLSAGKLVTFHFGDSPDDPRLAQFPNRAEELTAARMHVKSDKGASETACRIVFHRGWLSSFEFQDAPRELFQDAVRITSIDVLEDLMNPAELTGAIPLVTPVLDHIRLYVDVSNVVGPRSSEILLRFLRNVGTTVTPDFIGLLNESDGFTAGDWHFRGTGARRIVHPDVTYIITAENDDWALCFIEGSAEPQITLLDQVAVERRDMGTEFISAFIAAVRIPK